MYNTQRTRREVLQLGLGWSAAMTTPSRPRRDNQSAKSAASVITHFPTLAQVINGKRLIYFDTAATAQRPSEVVDAVTRFYSRDNANPAPNLHSLAKRSFDAYESARATVASFINASDPSEIVWTRGTTEGINLVASSWGEVNIERNDEIVLTVSEHASNMLPWQLLARRKGARIRYVDVLDDGKLDLASLKLQLTPRTKLVCFSHVSNVLGIINPAAEICRIVHQCGAKVLIDAAQSAPHVPLDVQQLDCDFLAFSSHKLMGPMGIGVLWARRSILEDMPPYQAGSNMAHAIAKEHWEYSEAGRKFGAGTPNVSGPVGLAAAIAFIQRIGFEQMRDHKLDQNGIAIRAGDMASLPLLQRFGVNRAARASLYLYNTTDEIDEFGRRLAAILSTG